MSILSAYKTQLKLYNKYMIKQRQQHRERNAAGMVQVRLSQRKEVIYIASEKNFENKIKDFLKEQGAWFIKYWAGAQFTKAGVPDILACVNGYFVGIEVKAQNGHPSELQLHNIKKIREAEGFAFVLYPSGYDEFKKFIIGLKHETFNRDMKEVIK